MRANLLYVVGAYFNPRRPPQRAQLARRWVKENLDCGVNITLVEHVFGERPYEFSNDEPDFKHVHLVQVRGPQQYELWLKEPLWNLGMSRLPEEAKYINCQDTDVRHVDANYGAETVHMLQHYAVGQTWTHSIDLDERGNVMRNEWGNDADRSFSAAFVAGDIKDTSGAYVPPRAFLKDAKWDARAHAGYSLALRRSVLTGGLGQPSGIGKLPDWDIIGAADYNMMRCFAGVMDTTQFGFPATPGYVRRYEQFARLCDLYVKQDIGVVNGTLLAGFHGHKTKRHYLTRSEIFAESNFDPDVDIAYDGNGLPYLCSDNRLLRDGTRRYNRLREEG